jgi:hypothetical protein
MGRNRDPFWQGFVEAYTVVTFVGSPVYMGMAVSHGLTLLAMILFASWLLSVWIICTEWADWG